MPPDSLYSWHVLHAYIATSQALRIDLIQDGRYASIFQAGALTFIQAWARAPPLALLGPCQLP